MQDHPRTAAPKLDLNLESLDILAALDDAGRQSLTAALEPIPVRRGDVLMRQGETADALYIVISGRFAVTIEGRAAPLAEIASGQPVGEIAFLSGGTRTATVTALRDSLVLRLDRASFDRLASKRPEMWRTLTVTLANRLGAEAASRPAPPDPRPRTIVLFGAGQAPLPAGFAERFADVLSRYGSTRLCRAADVERHLPDRADLDSPVATRRLNAIEAECAFVIFDAGDAPSPWAEKVIRQADLALAVAARETEPRPNALERMAAGFVPRHGRRLVLVHPQRGSASGTARWLEGRDVVMHHHVALDGDADLARLARFIDGRALGLVACGGGAFCTAHTGVYRALVEAGLEFDIMGGTSGGSAFTAAFALGTPAERIEEVVHDIFVTHGAMRRYTLPLLSIVDHTHYDRQLRRHFGGIDIEDMWIPYFAASADLSGYDLHLHRQGELWSAVRASGSIPALLPPYYSRDGRMLVDGCVLDNVPIKAMREIKSGPNVVVNFHPPDLERFEVDYDALPSRSQLLRSLFVPWRRRAGSGAPAIHTVVMRSLMANRLEYLRHLEADDLVLTPPFPAGMGPLDWHRHAELSAASYLWCRDELLRLAGIDHPCLAAARRT